MAGTKDLGRRIELVSMDPHCADITIALYDRSNGGAPRYLVHSYSRVPDAGNRLSDIERAMQVLGGLELGNGVLGFSCGVRHQLAIRRTFLEACKLGKDANLAPRPMNVEDKKLNGTVSVRGLGGGVYEVSADGPAETVGPRLESIVNGFRKLAEVDAVPGEPYRFRFACGQAHDALVGLLLPRALNVRAVLREQEQAAGRGTLVAPSAQK